MNLDLNPNKNDIKPPIIKTVAVTGEGVEELAKTIDQVFHQILNNDMLIKKRKERIKQELQELIRKIHLNQIISTFEAKIEDFSDKILKKEIDPYTAANAILKSEKIMF
jgi:LAO/AO transport system kinase